MFYVYVLKCHDGAYYVGQTSNLPIRLYHHFLGCGSVFTTKHHPIELCYVCPARDLNEADRLEVFYARLSTKSNLILQPKYIPMYFAILDIVADFGSDMEVFISHMFAKTEFRKDGSRRPGTVQVRPSAADIEIGHRRLMHHG